MRFAAIAVLASVALLAGGPLLADEGPQHAPPVIDDARFEFLKKLEGTWVGSPPQEGSPSGVIEFRLTAGGTAIEEREFVGTPMEMVTLYHMDGGNLVATHYCMLGNQPHLTAAKEVVDDRLSFSCNGKPGNTSSHDEAHVHGWSIRLDGDDRLLYSGELVEDGKVTETPSFVLTRERETASR